MRKLLLCLLPFCLFAEKVHFLPQADVGAPWLTGPLFTPSGEPIPYKHWSFEPYIIAFQYTGTYDPDGKVRRLPNLWNISIFSQIAYGIAPYVDFQIAPAFLVNFSQGASSIEFDDFVCNFDIQLY